jgi:hypothetical protein
VDRVGVDLAGQAQRLLDRVAAADGEVGAPLAQRCPQVVQGVEQERQPVR